MKISGKLLLCIGLASILGFSLWSQNGKKTFLTDSDGDGISNYMEELSSLDPSNDECRYSKFSNSCKDISVNGLLGKEYFIYILDESGSMRERIKGRTRMEVAKEIVIKYIKNLPENFSGIFTDFPMRLGMYSYGKTSSCEAIEEMQSPYKRLKRKKLISLVEQMKPNGRTPIAKSLDHVAAKIRKKKNGKFNVMLVTDGVESCRGNPIRAARDLISLNSLDVSVKLSVIGLGVPKDIESELKKIAEASNGTYHTVNSAEEFEEVFATPFRQMVKYLNGLVCLQKITDKVIACENLRRAKLNRGYQKLNNPFNTKVTSEQKKVFNEEKEMYESSTRKKLKTYNRFKSKGSEVLVKKANDLVKFLGKIQKLK
ncbi:MAG: VWA domain-containing protein [Spirochaetota bacterium]